MTLTEVSYYFRKLLPFAILFFILLLILYYVLKLLFLFLGGQHTNTIYTNTIFGKLNKPIINNATTSAHLKFTIDTIEGKPVTSTESAKVFFLPESPTHFGSREKVYLMAKIFGFDTNVIQYKLNDKDAVIKDDQQTLTVDISNFNFDYEYNIDNNPQVFQNSTTPDSTNSVNKAINFLKLVGRYPEELAQGKTNTIFFSYNPDLKRMTLLNSSDNSNMVEVDFYRADIEQYPIVSPSYFNSQNYVMMVFNGTDYKIIKAQIKFYEKSDTQIGIYPLKSGDLAWQELQEGKGWVIQNSQKQQNIVIKTMFLGYLDPDTYQPYMQPVYVFLGDNSFVAYVPAISSDYLGE